MSLADLAAKLEAVKSNTDDNPFANVRIDGVEDLGELLGYLCAADPNDGDVATRSQTIGQIATVLARQLTAHGINAPAAADVAKLVVYAVIGASARLRTASSPPATRARKG